MLEKKEVEADVKYNYFNKERKKKTKNDPLVTQKLILQSTRGFLYIPNGTENVQSGNMKKGFQ